MLDETSSRSRAGSLWAQPTWKTMVQRGQKWGMRRGLFAGRPLHSTPRSGFGWQHASEFCTSRLCSFGLWRMVKWAKVTAPASLYQITFFFLNSGAVRFFLFCCFSFLKFFLLLLWLFAEFCQGIRLLARICTLSSATCSLIPDHGQLQFHASPFPVRHFSSTYFSF